MSDSKFKPSFGIETILSGDLATDSEKFLLFMKAYYEWMQTSKIEFTDKVGTFQRGETIVGATVGATAKIKEIGIANDLIVSIETRVPFNLYETVTGQTSGATAKISSVVDNVVRRSGKLLDYRNIETSIDTYVDYLREELYPSIPITYYGNKRLIASKFREFFQSKSNEQSYRFLFKLLYNENIEFYYPGTDILRVSDGNFEKTQIIRTVAVSADTRDIFLFLNTTIRGETSGVLANVVDIKKFFIGALEVAEMTLKLVSGVFAAGETIVDIDDEDLSTTIYGIVSGVTIVDGGSGYEDGDIVTITGNGSEAQAKVSSIKESPISALKVNTVGHGYQLNTNATIDNSGTGGSGLLVQVTALANTYSVTSGANTYTVGEISEVSIINRGEGYFKKPSITLQDTTIASLGLLSDKVITINNAGSNYGVGNTLVFTGGSGTGAVGQIASVVESTTFDLLFEDGFQMKADGSYYDIIKNEDWSVKGAIKRVELTNFGTGYSSANLPSISITTTTGASANLVATNVQGKSANVTVDTSNNITGIGSIRAVEITNFGINYSAANASAATIGDGNANLTPVISGLGIREGVFLDDDGKINYKIIQDSYYYQDYSYVIKSGLAFQTYSDTLKSIIHPAGLQPFGEIQIFSDLDVHVELINNPDIQRLLVQIFTHLTVGAQYEFSSINMVIKVDTPVLRLDTNLLNIQEYVIHLVPEGDEETGITDVGVVTSEHSFVIQTPFELNVTATSATLPTTKFVIGHVDTLPGYGYNTYGNLPLTPIGVYGDDWSNTPISAIQNVRFSDLYGENPAYQSIMSLHIDNTLDISVSGITSKLKYETFAVSGTIPLLESIITTESLIVKPEVPIQLNVNDVAISMSTNAMERDLSTYITLSDLDTYSEYIVRVFIAPNVIDISAVTTTKFIINQEIYVNDVAISMSTNAMERDLSTYITLANLNTYGEYVVIVSPTPSVVDMSVAASSITPQKLASAENIISFYEELISDSKISDSENLTFNSLTPQSSYEGVSTSFAVSNFNGIYKNYPNSYSDYVTYVKIAGTVSSANAGFETLPISAYSAIAIDLIDDSLLSDLVPIVIGSGTNFVSDFSPGSVFVANNEYFMVEIIANTTYMTTDRLPANAFSGVVAHRISA